MGIVPDRQPEVPKGGAVGALGDVLAGSQELDHREGQVGEPKWIGLSLLHQKRLQRLGVGPAGKLVPVRFGDLGDAFPSLWSPDHPADGRESPFRQIAGNHSVRSDHEVLDDALGPVLLLHFEATDCIAIEYWPRLNRLEGQRSLSVPECRHVLCYLVLQAQVPVKSSCGADRPRGGAVPVQPCGHAVVGELRAIADARPEDIGALKRAVGAQCHLNDDGQPLFPGIQGGEVGGQLLGKHGEDLGRRVDRSRVVPRVPIDGRSIPDEGIHISHCDEDPAPASWHGLSNGELIQIAGVVVVDRGPQEISEIAN